MKRFYAGMLTAGFALAGAQVFADDMAAAPMSKSAMMKDCMAKMAAKNDGSTKMQMKAACKSQMKYSMSTGSSDATDGSMRKDDNASTAPSDTSKK